MRSHPLASRNAWFSHSLGQKRTLQLSTGILPIAATRKVNSALELVIQPYSMRSDVQDMREPGVGLPSVRMLRAIGFICSCVLALFNTVRVQATEQTKDEIVLDGGTHHLLNFPLGHPEDWSKAAQATLRGLCSGAWRGYKAFWEVRDEQLWLVRVLDNPCGDDHRAIQLNLIIPSSGSTPLPATWISGRLLVGYGGFVENQNPKLNYKRYLMLTVENGRITKREFQDRKLWDQ